MLELWQAAAEGIAEAAEQQRPADASGDVVEREAGVGHPGHAGQQRGQHAQQRHEAAEEHRLTTVSPEELLGALELGLVDAEEPTVPPDQDESAAPPDPIGPSIAEHSADG